MTAKPSLKALMERFPRHGRLEWIGLRPARRRSVRAVETADVRCPQGLEGDRYAGRSGSRAVTLIQAEHLPAIAALAGTGPLEVAVLRRNLLISGINLVALRGRPFRVGEALLEGTGPCDPCSRMEEVLGPGGYNAMRGHGGITASVLQPGTIRVGDPVIVL